MVFFIKTHLKRNSCWVLDGHRTPDPDGSLYAGVVSREIIRIATIYVALNEIDVVMAEISNTYHQVTSSNKYYIICGPEFGLEKIGKK